MRRAKIVATIGPASRAAAVLEALLRAGVDVVRLNFSHGEPSEHLAAARAAREIAARLDRPLAVLQDLAGPKVRTGSLEHDRPLELREGDSLVITTEQSVRGR